MGITPSQVDALSLITVPLVLQVVTKWGPTGAVIPFLYLAPPVPCA